MLVLRSEKWGLHKAMDTHSGGPVVPWFWSFRPGGRRKVASDAEYQEQWSLHSRGLFALRWTDPEDLREDSQGSSSWISNVV